MQAFQHIYHRVKSFVRYNFMLYCNFFVLFVLSFSLSKIDVLINFLPVLIAYLIVGLGGFLLNDLWDKETDRIAGKPNITNIIKPNLLTIIIGIVFLIGFVLVYQVAATITLLLAIQLLLLILYSVKLIRLKEKGIWGLITDAVYAHLIPELILLIFINIYLNTLFIPIFFLLFSFVIGLRDILIHQLHDLENDIKGGSRSYAIENKKSVVKLIGIFNGLLLPLIVVSMVETFIHSKHLFLIAILLSVIFCYFIQIYLLKKQNDQLIRIYIICSSFILGFIVIKQESFILLLLLIHPYFVSFLRSTLHALLIKFRYILKLILGFMLLTLIPLFVNNILYYLFGIFGRDLKKRPFYAKEHEPYFITRIRKLLN